MNKIKLITIFVILIFAMSVVYAAAPAPSQGTAPAAPSAGTPPAGGNALSKWWNKGSSTVGGWFTSGKKQFASLTQGQASTAVDLRTKIIDQAKDIADQRKEIDNMKGAGAPVVPSGTPAPAQPAAPSGTPVQQPATPAASAKVPTPADMQKKLLAASPNDLKSVCEEYNKYIKQNNADYQKATAENKKVFNTMCTRFGYTW